MSVGAALAVAGNARQCGPAACRTAAPPWRRQQLLMCAYCLMSRAGQRSQLDCSPRQGSRFSNWTRRINHIDSRRRGKDWLHALAGRAVQASLPLAEGPRGRGGG